MGGVTLDMKQHEEVFILICLDDGDEDHNDDDICENTNGRGGAEASPRSCLVSLSAISQQVEER